MENQLIIQDTRSVADIVVSVRTNIIEGNINPMDAYAVLTSLAMAIEQVKNDPQVRDICLRELSKYGKQGATIGEFTFTEAEAGVKYDYSQCGCSEYEELQENRTQIDNRLKEIEKALKVMPISGMADPETGEIWYPPVKSSKTIIKATKKK
jgi:hypothetical protein